MSVRVDQKSKICCAVWLFGFACAGSDVTTPDDSGDAAPELITAVALTFTPGGGGAALVFEWSDPEADGSPSVDPIVLADADDYGCTVAFRNDQSNPPEDVTAEIEEESHEHQLFFTGDGVEGPATGENSAALIGHVYADTDANGFPVGLENTVTTLMTGTRQLVVTLRHLPREGAPVKTGTLADLVASEGLSALPGETDAQVTFDLTVQ
jgi:hypothetical protein